MSTKGKNVPIRVKPNKASILHVTDNGTRVAGCSLFIGICSRNNPTDESRECKYFLHDSWYKIFLSLHSREDAVISLQAVEAETQRENQKLFRCPES